VDQIQAIGYVRSFAEQVRQRFDVRQIILFGSYAKGTSRDESDIDVAVITKSPVADWLEASAQLYKIGGDIDLSIEPHLLDYEHDRSGFLDEIRRTGEVIYDSDQ
jgi:predicted nucleotidyltransferase